VGGFVVQRLGCLGTRGNLFLGVLVRALVAQEPDVPSTPTDEEHTDAAERNRQDTYAQYGKHHLV